MPKRARRPATGRPASKLTFTHFSLDYKTRFEKSSQAFSASEPPQCQLQILSSCYMSIRPGKSTFSTPLTFCVGAILVVNLRDNLFKHFVCYLQQHFRQHAPNLRVDRGLAHRLGILQGRYVSDQMLRFTVSFFKLAILRPCAPPERPAWRSC